MIKRLLCCLLIIAGSLAGFTQSADRIITIDEVSRIEKTLSADDMEGRAPGSPGIEKAADFIAQEFKKAGIDPVANNSYFQEFTMQRIRFQSAEASVDGNKLEQQLFAAFSAEEVLTASETSGYEVKQVGASEKLVEVIRPLFATDKKVVVFADTMHRAMLMRLKQSFRTAFNHTAKVIVLLTPAVPSKWQIEYRQTITKQPLKNVVGILPGKSRKDEYVIFSGHYDHLGIGRPNSAGDSIYNGANDDASGITAVIMLARYYAKQRNNERTLIFAAFTAEERGGFGSQYFSRQFEPEKVMAMFNIEMIGTESKWGTNSAFITGYDKTDMGAIMQKNLEGSKFRFYPDPYPEQNLFYRSDNATLAALGVPAHTISTSKMDSEKYYHTVDDEFETLDMKNMTEIIKSIAVSAASIVAGKDTPSRVKND